MLPIEKGCLAIIVKSKTKHLGEAVKVGNFIGEINGGKNKNNWETNIYHKDALIVADESQLMRIDGYKQETKQKVEVMR